MRCFWATSLSVQTGFATGDRERSALWGRHFLFLRLVDGCNFAELEHNTWFEIDSLKGDENLPRECAAQAARRKIVRQLARAGVLTIALWLWLCLGTNPTAGQDATAKGDRIRGIVVNSVTHEAIGRALVSSPDERFAIMTDSDGRFEFIIPSGTNASGESAQSGMVALNTTGPQTGAVNRPYALTARKPGFLNDGQQNVNLESGSREITISLVPEALIVGHIALPTAAAPDSVQAEIYRREVRDGRAHWVPAGNANSRPNGDFRFAELPAGSYKLLTRELLGRDPKDAAPGGQVYGYPPVYYPSTPDFAAPGMIELAAGKTMRADLSLAKQPYYPIRIPVANVPPGVPLSVSVSVQGHKGPGYSLGYNSEQRIEGLLPAGSYRNEGLRSDSCGGIGEHRCPRTAWWAGHDGIAESTDRGQGNGGVHLATKQ